FVGCLDGMSEACRALDFPIVSGNVSLYNESKATGGGSAILPTPAIGAIGLLADWTKTATVAFKASGEAIFVIGQSNGHLGQSSWLRVIHGREDGPPPPVDLVRERDHAEFVRNLIDQGLVSAVHDISDGGLLVAVAEMALAGNIGATLDEIGDHFTAFGEDQARYVVTSHNAEAIQAAGIPMTRIGTTGGDTLQIHGKQITLTDLRTAHEGFFPALMDA
ncbi:MAG: phosphoribosylformylglycinamidine synthase II, partial [Alphaproteobacteria bacterium]|nr:phosphoribosylformylglycinamidine synthase II [Alphaproteobacteria bacterium]